MATKGFIPGESVEVVDPLGYHGMAVVLDEQTTPTHAVLVRMLTITDRTDQSMVGRETWVLAGHVTSVLDQAH